MSEIYSGIVKEIGGKELGKTGNEKPRKVVVSDSPDYQGKTFRCWANTDDFQLLRQALDEGMEVEIHYDINPIPGTDYTQNMVSSVLSTNGQDGQVAAQVPLQAPQAERSEGTTGGGSAPRGSSATSNTTHEIEAAWALGVVVQAFGNSLDQEAMAQKAHQLIVLKRQIASEL